MRASLAPKDGKVHVVMLNSFSKFLNQTFECENKYTGQIDAIISAMQDDGYEILDVKFNSIQGQRLTGSMEGFHTLVTYRQERTKGQHSASETLSNPERIPDLREF